MRLIYIEDEPKIGKYVKKSLEQEGFIVDWFELGNLALEEFKIISYDCVILDLNLPDIDGLDLLQKFKDISSITPVLLLTARSTQEEVNKGFIEGCDDYLVKPFDLSELSFRVKSLIRRSSNLKDTTITLGNLKFNSITKEVILNNELVELTNKELGILEYLILNKGKVISQEELLEHVWDREVNIFTDSVRTTIKTLRQKVDPNKKLILNFKGRGYAIKN